VQFVSLLWYAYADTGQELYYAVIVPRIGELELCVSKRRTPTIYTEATFTRGEALTTYEVAEDQMSTSRFQGDDIPPGKTELREGDGLGSLIQTTEDQEIANCTLEFDFQREYTRAGGAVFTWSKTG
jgi:hypothetical protein